MGFFGKVKAKTRVFIDNERKKAQEHREYNKKLKDAVKKSRREAYMKEAQRQAQLKAKIDAQRKYNPTPQQRQARMGGLSIPSSLLDPVGFSMGTEQKVVQKIQQKRSSKKKKKKKSPTQRTKSYVPKKDPLHDLIWNT